jgi:hypothetical protein
VAPRPADRAFHGEHDAQAPLVRTSLRARRSHDA